MRIKLLILSIVLTVTMFSCKNENNTNIQIEPATIYHNGDIITMEGDEANYVEAVVVQKGKIVFLGPKAQALDSYKKCF